MPILLMGTDIEPKTVFMFMFKFSYLTFQYYRRSNFRFKLLRIFIRAIWFKSKLVKN